MEVVSIFKSINGEVCQWGQGSWAVFVRFFGCSAHCLYCDTPYSWQEGLRVEDLSVQSIVNKIKMFNIKRVVLTGGEPLEQPIDQLILLIHQLQGLGYEISIETNGLQDMDNIMMHTSGLSLVADLKLPSAGKHVRSKVNLDRYSVLGPTDFIKCVISSTQDFKIALDSVAEINRKKLNISKALPKIYFSPNTDSMPPFTLFSLMMHHAPSFIGFNFQIHKIIFGSDWRKEEKE